MRQVFKANTFDHEALFFLKHTPFVYVLLNHEVYLNFNRKDCVWISDW